MAVSEHEAQPEPQPCHVSFPPFVALGMSLSCSFLVLAFGVIVVGALLSLLSRRPAVLPPSPPPFPSRNLEEVCRFPELPARKPLTYQAKQLIAREIEMERMRRAEALARDGDSPQVSSPLAWGRARLVGWILPLEWPCPVSSHHIHFLQVDGSPPKAKGPQGAAGGKGAQPPTPRSQEQRLERILKRAALEDQVWGLEGGVGVGLCYLGTGWL